MTFEEIDRALSSWQQRLAAIADNLLQLQSDPTYQVLTGSGGVTLTGATAKRVLPALKSIETIFHQFSLLQAAIDRAAQLRKDSRSVFGRDQALREIESLLMGPSIQLPADAVPLKDRSLLSGAAGTLMVRPEELLASMDKAFGEARDAVLLVSGAWDELAREAGAAEAEMERLRGAGCAVGALEAALGAVKEQVQCDPVAAREELRGKLLPGIAAAARELEERARVRQGLVAAREMLARLRAVEGEWEAAAAVNRAKIVGGGAATSLVSHAQGLGEWLGRLEARSGEERAETLARGLENLRKALNQALEVSVLAFERERAPLELRGELRGRLDALKAKARVYGLAEDAAVAGLAGQAEALLYARPTDVARAAAAVEAYERRLAVPAASRQRNERASEEGR